METLQPKLRFPEFDGNWESKIFKKTCVINPSNKKLPQKFIYIDLESVNNGLLHKENEILLDEAPSRAQRLLNKKDVLFQMVRPYQKNNFYFDKEGDYVASTGYAQLRANDNSKFLFQYIHNQSFVDRVIEKCTGSNYPAINSTDLSNIFVVFPENNEQTKIANFLSEVDEKINLLKEKKVLLEDYKKGIMQKIFNQDIRFKDDNGEDFEDWEEKSLGEIGTFQTSSIDKLSRDEEEEVFLVNYMNVYRHENINNYTKENLQIVTAKDSQINSCNLKRGDILFTPSSETPDDIGHSVVIFEDLENCVYSYHLMRFRPNIEIDILYSHYFCNNTKVLGQISRLATGSTRFTISVKSFSSIIIDLPSLKEQTKIANFLSAIDEKIELVSNQIQDTQEYKKGLLQQMFV
jgi:type I restriction enzyme S subunit